MAQKLKYMFILVCIFLIVDASSQIKEMQIKQIAIFQPDIQSYSATKFTFNNQAHPFLPKHQGQYFVLHWASNQHDQLKQIFPQRQQKQIQRINRLMDRTQFSEDQQRSKLIQIGIVALFIVLMFTRDETQQETDQTSAKLQIPNEDLEQSDNFKVFNRTTLNQ